MADEADTTEIIIPGDATEDVVVDTAAAAKPQKRPTENAEAAVELLKKQLAEKTESEKSARDLADRNAVAAAEAERAARQSAGHAAEATRVAQSHELDSVSNALGATNRELEGLEGKLASAYEAGEFGTVAKLQGQIGKLGAKIAQLEEGKAFLEARAKERPAEPVARSPEEQREAFLKSRTAPTATWLRANPKFFSDPDFRRKVESADGYVANILGLGRDTPEYFAKIEETVGLRPPSTTAAATVVDRSSDGAEAAKAPPARAAAPAAPPSRTVPTARPDRDTRVTLTREERDAAQWLFPKQKPDDPDPEILFARNKVELMKEGKLLGHDGRPMGPQI